MLSNSAYTPAYICNWHLLYQSVVACPSLVDLMQIFSADCGFVIQRFWGACGCYLKGFSTYPNDIPLMNCLYEMNSFSLTWWESACLVHRGRAEWRWGSGRPELKLWMRGCRSQWVPTLSQTRVWRFLFPTHPSPLLSHPSLPLLPIIHLFPRHDRRTHGHNQPPLKPNGEDHTETY